MSDAEPLRVYLQGWDDAQRSLLNTLCYVPDDQLPEVMRLIRADKKLSPRRLTP